jgi:hypothetical protein
MSRSSSPPDTPIDARFHPLLVTLSLGFLAMTGQATAHNLGTGKAVPIGHQVGDPSTAYGRPPGAPAFEAVFVVTM